MTLQLYVDSAHQEWNAAVQKHQRKALDPCQSSGELLLLVNAPFDAMTSALIDFIDVDIPRLVGRGAESNSLRSTVANSASTAVFLSSVTATALQMSFTNTSTPISNAVNFFYFASLFCSTSAAGCGFALQAGSWWMGNNMK